MGHSQYGPPLAGILQMDFGWRLLLYMDMTTHLNPLQVGALVAIQLLELTHLALILLSFKSYLMVSTIHQVFPYKLPPLICFRRFLLLSMKAQSHLSISRLQTLLLGHQCRTPFRALVQQTYLVER